MRDCPNCGDPLSVHGVCGSCAYGHAKMRAPTVQRGAAQRPAWLPPPCSQSQWEEHRRTAAIWLPRIKAQLAAAALKPRPDAIPHLLSTMATSGIDYDYEAVVERRAIEQESR